MIHESSIFNPSRSRISRDICHGIIVGYIEQFVLIQRGNIEYLYTSVINNSFLSCFFKRFYFVANSSSNNIYIYILESTREIRRKEKLVKGETNFKMSIRPIPSPATFETRKERKKRFLGQGWIENEAWKYGWIVGTKQFLRAATGRR